MRIYLLNGFDIADQITVLNLRFKGRCFRVSRKWYRKVCELDYLGDCDFHLVVSNKEHSPYIPELQ